MQLMTKDFLIYQQNLRKVCSSWEAIVKGLSNLLLYSTMELD